MAPASVPAIIAALWLAGAVVTWNMVFDAHIVKGARDYVDSQQLFIEGRGPRQDMEQSMAAARSAGLRSAAFWTGVELVSGGRADRRGPAQKPAPPRPAGRAASFFSIAGSASSSTSPTTCRLLALTLSSVSAAVCHGG